jgi:hypothetical protein
VDFSRHVRIAASFKSVQIAARIFSTWSKNAEADRFLCFQSYAVLVTDKEREFYLAARLAAIRQAHAAEFIQRTPHYSQGGGFHPRGSDKGAIE